MKDWVKDKSMKAVLGHFGSSGPLSLIRSRLVQNLLKTSAISYWCQELPISKPMLFLVLIYFKMVQFIIGVRFLALVARFLPTLLKAGSLFFSHMY